VAGLSCGFCLGPRAERNDRRRPLLLLSPATRMRRTRKRRKKGLFCLTLEFADQRGRRAHPLRPAEAGAASLPFRNQKSRLLDPRRLGPFDGAVSMKPANGARGVPA
jgi:hypothetical protein